MVAEVGPPGVVTVELQQLQHRHFAGLLEMETEVGAEEAVVAMGSQVDYDGDGGDDVHCSAEC